MRGWLRALLWFGGALAIVVGALRYWFIDFHRVPEDTSDPRNWSNAPNLEPGDFVLVWRGGTPHVGDLVRCPDPADPTRWMVARVIGIGGDRIEWTEAGLRINNFRVRTVACANPPRKVFSPEMGAEVDVPCNGEEIGGSQHDADQVPTAIGMPAPATVEAGKLFLLSDNRLSPWTYDSRSVEVGQIPQEQCTQRLIVRLWSQKGWSDSERRFTFLF